MDNQEMQYLFEIGDYERLMYKINTNESSSIDEQIEGLIYKSRMMAMMDQWEDGFEFAEKAIEISQTHQLELLEMYSLIAKGYNCNRSRHGMLESTISQLEIKLAIINISIPEDKKLQIQGDIHFLKGWYQFNATQIESSREELKKSLEIRRKLNDNAGIAEVLLHLCFTHLEWSGTPEIGLEYGEEGIKIAEKIQNKHLMGLAYNWYGNGIGMHKDITEGLAIVEKSIKIYTQLGEWGEGKLRRVYNNISISYRNIEDFEKALEYQSLYLQLAEKSNDLSSKGGAYHNLSITYVMMNEFEKAIENRKSSLDIAYKINNKGLIATYHIFLGMIYFWKGDLNLAENEYLLAKKIRSELGSVHTLLSTYLGLAVVYTFKMQTEKALNKIEEILDAIKNIKNDELRGWVYLIKGINNRTIDTLDQAFEDFSMCGDYWSKLPDAGTTNKLFLMSFLYFQKVLLYQEMGKLDKAEELYKELTEKTVGVKSNWIKLRNRCIEALILKSKARGSSKFQAQAIFQEIIDSKIIDIQIYSLAMLNLCELLVLEMKISEDPEAILKELIVIVNKMSDMGKSQSMPMLLVMGDFIHGKIDLVHNDLESARNNFVRAINIAQEHSLNSLLSKVEVEKDYVETQISKWKDDSDKDLSLIERVEKAQIQEYLSHAISVKEKMVNSGSIGN